MAPVVPSGAEHVCFPCKRKFPSAATLDRHKRTSDVHRRMMDKQEDLMKKRKSELIAAVQSVRTHIMDAEEALQTQVQLNENVQNKRMVLEMQLRQLLHEYGQAQEIVEDSRLTRECRRSGVRKQERHREARVGRLALTAGATAWQGNKDVQEDRYLLDIDLDSPEGHKVAGFAVMDGHSGSLCVDHLVERLPVNLQKCLSAKPSLNEEHLKQAVQEACVLTDDEFLKQARQLEVLDGSTMVLGLVYPEDARPGSSGIREPGSCRLLLANVGDSRAVLCTSRDAPGGVGLMALPLSEDHKPNRPDEQRRIEAKGGVVDFQGVWRVFTPSSANFGGQTIQRWGLAVSRAFGDLLLKEAEKYECAGVAPGGLVNSTPEFRVFDLEPNVDRFLVLACDGVWDVVSNEEAISICADQSSAKDAATALLKRTYAANSDDNMTAIVVTWRAVD
mmetsp:Transcript_100330/g.189291  ORF Transcript_100330/g.189291 Transcript_100330/m.189291 type:complete len:447 (-) Transcript_100330:68-1408(-)